MRQIATNLLMASVLSATTSAAFASANFAGEHLGGMVIRKAMPTIVECHVEKSYVSGGQAVCGAQVLTVYQCYKNMMTDKGVQIAAFGNLVENNGRCDYPVAEYHAAAFRDQ